MDFLQVSELGFSHQGVAVLSDVSFKQQQFQRVAIAGETGSGKTTLLKLIGGLLQPETGAVYFDAVKVPGANEKLVPGHPQIAYLSQHFELRNNYRVEEILEYATLVDGIKARRILTVCRIDHLLKRKTDQLSGGERQRIALARSLLTGPSLMLLDEPFSNLDGFHRDLLWEILDEMEKSLGLTSMLVSHDPADSLSWAQELIVLKDGHLLQRGSPMEIYQKPINSYTARLFGKYNLLPQEKGFLFARPEQLERMYTPSGSTVQAVMQKAIYCGSHYEWQLDANGNRLYFRSNEKGLPAGSRVLVGVRENIPRWIVKREF